jgi:hypothetical protein
MPDSDELDSLRQMAERLKRLVEERGGQESLKSILVAHLDGAMRRLMKVTEPIEFQRMIGRYQAVIAIMDTIYGQLELFQVRIDELEARKREQEMSEQPRRIERGLKDDGF